MGRPRRQHQADDAAKAASEAARVLQQRSQAARQEPVEKVPEAPPEEKPEDYVPPKRYSEQRTAMLEEIVSSRPRDVVEAAPEAHEKPVEAAPEAHEKPVEAAPEAHEKPVEAAPEAPKTVKVKVDGEEFEVPQEDVDASGGVRAYQIQRAAENRLKKTNEVLAEIRKAQSEFMDLQKQAQKPKEPEITDDQFIASKMDTVRFGTPEEAAKAWREIMSRQVKPLDQNAIVEQAVNRFRHDQAVQQFDQEHQDIVTNPLLLKLIVSLRNERIPQLKGPVDWTTFYRTIGNEVRSIVGKPTSTTTTQSTTSGTPSQQSEKEAKKAATVVNLPTSAARAALPQEEKPETREDILRGMRKTRGLPVD